MRKIGTRILEARQRRGLSQRALAEALGVTVQAVSQWENGKTDPRSRLGPLSAALVVDADWLAGDIDGPSEKTEDEVFDSGLNVPLVDFLDLPYFLRFISPDPIIMAETYLRSTVDPVGKLFALRIFHEDKYFKKGDILVFDNGIEPINGDFAAIIVFNKNFSQLSALKDANALTKVVTGSIARIATPADGEPSSTDFAAVSLDDGERPIDRAVVVVATLVEHRKFRSAPLNELSDNA